MATNRNSTLYTNVFVNKYLADARDVRGRCHVYPFEHTVVSGETGGASAGVQDSVNLTIIPALCRIIGISLSAENLWASAGVNGTLQIGDALDDDRYVTAFEAYTAAGGPIATEKIQVNILAHTGQNYKLTVDTTMVLTWKTANPTVGKTLKGCFFVIPAV